MIERRDDGGIAVLQLQHGKANALDLEFVAALQRELEACAEADAIVITGCHRVFCAGVDLVRVGAGDAAYIEPFLTGLADFFVRLFGWPRPVVAAVNGHAIAGGCIMALACDMRVAAVGDWRLGAPELQVGVAFPAIALEILRFATPATPIAKSIYSGSSWSPVAALDAGIIDELVPRDDLLPNAIAHARRLAQVPATTFSLTKRYLRQDVLRRVQNAGEIDREIRAAWTSPPVQAAIRDYAQRVLGK